jgi:NAD+ kinase
MTFGIVGNTAKPAVREVSVALTKHLGRLKIPYVVHDELARFVGTLEPSCSEKELVRRSEIVVALGGDGTMLAAARMVGPHGIPILGVNLGKLGFLAEVSVEEMNPSIDDILRGTYAVEERMALVASSNKESKDYAALNEVVVDKGGSPRVIDLETHVNNDYLVTYTADGIILNTPTGSTAYSLATGGPIVAPQARVITVNPLAPHTLTARPVVVPDDSVIRIVVNSSPKPVHITTDGQAEGFYEAPVEFTIKKAPYTVKLIKRKQRSFYELLRTKLMWGRDVRVGR